MKFGCECGRKRYAAKEKDRQPKEFVVDLDGVVVTNCRKRKSTRKNYGNMPAFTNHRRLKNSDCPFQFSLVAYTYTHCKHFIILAFTPTAQINADTNKYCGQNMRTQVKMFSNDDCHIRMRSTSSPGFSTPGFTKTLMYRKRYIRVFKP